MEITPTAANVGQYARIVRDRAMLRNLATAAGEIRETVLSGVGTPRKSSRAPRRRSTPCETATPARPYSTSAW